MQITVTSELTAVSAIISDPSTGSVEAIAPPGREAARASAGPASRPNARKTITGMPTVPKTPIGSRTKIFTSSQVSRSRFTEWSLANRSAGQPQEDVLERWQFSPKIGDADAMLRDAGDGVG